MGPHSIVEQQGCTNACTRAVDVDGLCCIKQARILHKHNVGLAVCFIQLALFAQPGVVFHEHVVSHTYVVAHRNRCISYD